MTPRSTDQGASRLTKPLVDRRGSTRLALWFNVPGLDPSPLGGPLSATVLQNRKASEYQRSAHTVFGIKYHVVIREY